MEFAAVRLPSKKRNPKTSQDPQPFNGRADLVYQDKLSNTYLVELKVLNEKDIDTGGITFFDCPQANLIKCQWQADYRKRFVRGG